MKRISTINFENKFLMELYIDISIFGLNKKINNI